MPPKGVGLCLAILGCLVIYIVVIARRPPRIASCRPRKSPQDHLGVLQYLLYKTRDDKYLLDLQRVNGPQFLFLDLCAAFLAQLRVL
ncbi:hypothetical protein Syun_023463 [Stephania yunnanensis]|uniref:non-specific serine/threonine protein kinase n=1 Tax=Stephania yunnanensis TaxID=152371 RepID=A0AAP0FC99_9MAGN